jgi:hypothetical protein
LLAVQADAAVREASDDLVSAIGGTVGRDEDFQFFLRIVAA